MKPFDLKLAKAGQSIQTRDGRHARIVCYDIKTSYDTTCILVLVEQGNREIPYKYTFGGSCMETEKRDLDLFMVSTKKEGWINLYHSSVYVAEASNIYETKEKALKGKGGKGYITTIKIEWEE